MNSRQAKQTTKDLLAEVDKLITDLSQPPATPAQSLEDRYFDEIIEMLRQADLEHPNEPLPVTKPEENNDEFMNEILKELEAHDKEEEEKENLSNEPVAMEIADTRSSENDVKQRPEIDHQAHHDNMRIANQFLIIQFLVKQLPLWSPAKNAYLKIINDTHPDVYLKVHQLIQTANVIANQFRHKQTGFFSRQLFGKSNQIHLAIAAMDTNTEPKLQNKLCMT